MDPAAWRPWYEAIARDFGFDARADEAARDALDALLSTHEEPDLAAMADALRGREAWIVGAAATGDDAARIPAGAAVLVADAAAAVALPALPQPPLAVVTDLDGDVAAQREANARGVPLFVHAHGDNLDALRREVPRLTGPVAGTTQVAPRGRVRAFGGFTDGDRACCVAADLGASSLALVGFDYDAPVAKPGRDPAVKRRKLAWARRIVEGLDVPARHVGRHSTAK
ncbi:MAG TPA: hypothetical protein VHH36_08390 [Candidatus Thermoplasmatota archaeon]|nr:hypothetical protein [Candidatus Thermoplasmatota archaeon]